MAKSIDSFDDAHRIVNRALAFAGGKHSTLLAPVTDTTTFEELAPEAYMLDGYTLLITIGCDVARTGEVFCDDPIAPDVETETPLEDAVAWIKSQRTGT